MFRVLGAIEGPSDYQIILNDVTVSVSACAGMIFYRKNLEEQINQSVFPGLQGGPHNHTISGIAVALKMAQAPEFKQYQQQIVSNCRAMADR